jgi:hypothetical protein
LPAAAAAIVALVAPMTASPAATPSAPGAPILDVTVAGGFTTAEYAFSTLPQYYLTADGRLVSQGPQIMIYPAPALPNLRSRQLNGSARSKLLAAAARAGLTRKAPDYGRPGVADVGTTTITLRSGGKTYVHAIYALGFDPGPATPGLTAGQKAARAKVETFVKLLGDPRKSFGTASVGPDKELAPTAFRVRATVAPIADPSKPTVPGDLVPAPARDWPVAAVILASATECAPVPATPALLAELRQVSQIQQWRQGGVVYNATLRPILPGEPTCPER